MVQLVKNLHASAADTRDVGSIPGWEDPLEVEMVTHSSILAWKIPWTEEAARFHFTSHLPISELLFQLWRCGSAGCGPLFLRIGQGEA